MIDSKIISAKFKKGDFCYIHANSSIVTAYFETFGQPLDEKNLIAACFEGICTEVKAKWYWSKFMVYNDQCITPTDDEFVINEFNL